MSDNTNKSRDLQQKLEQLENEWKIFLYDGIVYAMERTEVESLIRQMDRLIAKLEKLRKTYTNPYY